LKKKTNCKGNNYFDVDFSADGTVLDVENNFGTSDIKYLEAIICFIKVGYNEYLELLLFIYHLFLYANILLKELKA